jgi:4-amino-4-deoxy-L-arabinose transferase-like glycosyltransferase
MTELTKGAPAHPVLATLAVIGGALVLRLALAAAVGLGTDEAYTVAVSRQLSLSYFDHPPLHQWITHLASPWLGEGRWLRLPFIVLFAGTSWLLFLITRRLYGAPAGFWAVVTLNLSGFFTLSAGSWIVPDGALLFALSLAAYALTRLFFPGAGETPRAPVWWLIVGLGLGLGGLAKYHAVLIGLGVFAFLLATAKGRRALVTPWPWLAASLALALVSPVLIWNAQHGWVSFAFQAGRTQGAGVAPWLIPASLLAQAAWLLPWVAAALVLGAWSALKEARDRRLIFLACLSLPTIAVFSLAPAFGNLGLPHWAMPGWLFLMPLAGRWLAALAETSPSPGRWAQRTAVGSGVVLALLAGQAATGALGHLASAVSRNDPTLELMGWEAAPAALATAGVTMPPDGFIVADAWHSAGRLDLAFQGAVVVAPGPADARHFAFIVDQSRLMGRDALVIVRARREAQMRAQLAGHFAELGPSKPFAIGRGGLAEIPLVAFEAKRFTTALPWPYGRPS